MGKSAKIGRMPALDKFKSKGGGPPSGGKASKPEGVHKKQANAMPSHGKAKGKSFVGGGSKGKK